MNVIAPYINDLEFDYFCTFTTAKPTGLASIRKIAKKTIDFIRFGDLNFNSFDCHWPGDSDASLFWCAEPFDAKQGVTGANLRHPDTGFNVNHYTTTRYHWHGLLKSEIDPQILWNWYSNKYGSETNRARCQILPNKDSYGAACYVSKYVTKSLSDYDFEISAKHSSELRRKNTENKVISQ